MNFKSFFPILFFALTCLCLARCAALQQKPQETVKTQKPVNNKNNTDKESRLRKDIADYAHQQLGTSYVYAGKNTQGFDCSGFVFFVMNKYGISLPGSSRSQEKQGKAISPMSAKTGDLIFFRRDKNGEVFHVAIVYSNDKNGLQVIHSTSSRGVVLDNISTNTYWKPKISTARNVISH